MEIFLVRIFPHLDWIRTFTDAGKYGPEKTPYLDIFHAVKVHSRVVKLTANFILITFIRILF